MKDVECWVLSDERLLILIKRMLTTTTWMIPVRMNRDVIWMGSEDADSAIAAELIFVSHWEFIVIHKTFLSIHTCVDCTLAICPLIRVMPWCFELYNYSYSPKTIPGQINIKFVLKFSTITTLYCWMLNVEYLLRYCRLLYMVPTK